jgi:hypothetical protein
VVTVTTTTGAEQVSGTSPDLREGTLIIADGNGDNVALYAPGVWQKAIVVPS